MSNIGIKEDTIQVTGNKNKVSFADELSKCKDEIISDLKKQASVEKKEQIKKDVLSGNYEIDATSIAKKMIVNGFDFKI